MFIYLRVKVRNNLHLFIFVRTNLSYMNRKSKLLFSLFLFGFSNYALAQIRFSHEIGAIVGPEAFQSDYGERHDLSTNSGNTGYAIGIIHYFNFLCDGVGDYFIPKTYFNDHFKIRTELSYTKTNFKNFGQWVAADKTSLGADQLRAMRGSTNLTNLGMQVEYYPYSIQEFSATTTSWAPFISLGSQFSFYNAKATSTMGPLGTPLATFPKYLIPSVGRPYGFSNEERTVWSIVSSVGTRYKLSPLSDLMLDLRIQYYFSDWVDGINPNKTIYKENKANDWLVWLNIGYIYYL